MNINNENKYQPKQAPVTSPSQYLSNSRSQFLQQPQQKVTPNNSSWASRNNDTAVSPLIFMIRGMTNICYPIVKITE